MTLQSCWNNHNTWANSAANSLPLQGARCPPVCSPQTFVLVLIPPELEVLMLDDSLDFCTAVAGREQAPLQLHGGPATEKDPSP